MKNSTLFLNEYHPPDSNGQTQNMNRTVTAWLTKELHK